MSNEVIHTTATRTIYGRTISHNDQTVIPAGTPIEFREVRGNKYRGRTRIDGVVVQTHAYTAAQMHAVANID